MPRISISACRVHFGEVPAGRHGSFQGRVPCDGTRGGCAARDFERANRQTRRHPPSPRRQRPRPDPPPGGSCDRDNVSGRKSFANSNRHLRPAIAGFARREMRPGPLSLLSSSRRSRGQPWSAAIPRRRCRASPPSRPRLPLPPQLCLQRFDGTLDLNGAPSINIAAGLFAVRNVRPARSRSPDIRFFSRPAPSPLGH